MSQVSRRISKRVWSKDVISFNIIGYLLLSLFMLLCIIPFILIIVSSFTPEDVLIKGGYSLLPRGFSLKGYSMCIKNPLSILTAYGNTLFVTGVGTIISIFITTMAGYVLSRKYFKWRNGFSFFFFFTMLFQGGLVPWYIICTSYLNFKNNIYALILPLLFSVWNMIIAKSFMRSIPDAISESAKIDGAKEFRIYAQLYLPLSAPLIATLTLFTALSYWNDWYNCMLFINIEEKYTLQYYLQYMLNKADALRRVAAMSSGAVSIPLSEVPMESMKMAMTVITTGPIILLYPFVQRYFIKGLTIGAVKG